MKLFRKSSGISERHRRLVWQAVSLLLAYPDSDEGGMSYPERLRVVAGALGELPPALADPLGRTVAELAGGVTGAGGANSPDSADRPDSPGGPDVYAASKAFVDTFDLRRRRSLLLTYWTDGDTRNRGQAMRQFIMAYREAGAEPPQDEMPDHLAVVLEFGAAVDVQAGLALLKRYRAPLELLRQGLEDYGSPYEGAVAAVLETVPEMEPGETLREAQRIANEGPRQESVGLEPYSVTVPVESLTASLRTVGGAK